MRQASKPPPRLASSFQRQASNYTGMYGGYASSCWDDFLGEIEQEVRSSAPMHALEKPGCSASADLDVGALQGLCTRTEESQSPSSQSAFQSPVRRQASQAWDLYIRKIWRSRKVDEVQRGPASRRTSWKSDESQQPSKMAISGVVGDAADQVAQPSMSGKMLRRKLWKPWNLKKHDVVRPFPRLAQEGGERLQSKISGHREDDDHSSLESPQEENDSAALKKRASADPRTELELDLLELPGSLLC
mmetsp:Transcript_67652/g.122007  ORF Transcript_67652/g.122007 Transcript_67652/m.122007 type:complete len:246 (+) Transcript_67652:79-816(+)|eukprot:CAMPEP_0115059738 /NCGR_PEP_ID=MMETSP0227-20121206/7082_1 /TAXON_ID=89957 /ORGANISM="Polarella glacialis, Strain CCMP 1383" /LENGTH=245 /DNA_ID=CAMNT_0002444889 /DNA_START=63 /DNA_END=800 /DNA_ORIENTATION=-